MTHPTVDSSKMLKVWFTDALILQIEPCNPPDFFNFFQSEHSGFDLTEI